MQIPIVQQTEDIAGDLVFTQPKFYFGQVLEDPKGDPGMVFGMHFSGEWHYKLVYVHSDAVSQAYSESSLAIATHEIVAFQEVKSLKPSSY